MCKAVIISANYIAGATVSIKEQKRASREGAEKAERKEAEKTERYTAARVVHEGVQ